MRVSFIVIYILIHLIQYSIASLNDSRNNSKIYNQLLENSLLKAAGEYVERENQYNVSQCYRDIGIWMKAFPFEMWALKSELYLKILFIGHLEINLNFELRFFLSSKCVLIYYSFF